MLAHELFELLSATTWKTIDRASGRRILFGEDAITSINLLTLNNARSTIFAIEDTRISESTKGCDFELWIGSDSTAWRRYAAQAKKIQPSTNTYAQLKHMVGGTLQIDILETYSKANNAVPIYCLYSHSVQTGDWSCCLPNDQEQLGCSVTPASVIRKAIETRGGRSFIEIQSNSQTLPWRCLVRCASAGSHSCSRTDLWPEAQTVSDYKALPPPLARVLETRTSQSLGDSEGAFSAESQLRPQWIVVINVDRQRGGA